MELNADVISLVVGILVLGYAVWYLSDAHRKGQDGSIMSKRLASLAAAALFLVVSSPIVYDYTDAAFRAVLGPQAALKQGMCPTALGIGVHAAVYGLVARGLMG